MGEPITTVSTTSTAIEVQYFAGDRRFTSTTSFYDAKTLEMLSEKSSASCCGSGSFTTATRNQDGSYDVTLEVQPPDACERAGVRCKDHYHLLPASGLLVTDFALVPWIYNQTHASSLDLLVIDPVGASPEPVGLKKLYLSDESAGAGSADAPVGDRVLRVTGDVSATLLYDPCGFTLDHVWLNR